MWPLRPAQVTPSNLNVVITQKALYSSEYTYCMLLVLSQGGGKHDQVFLLLLIPRSKNQTSKDGISEYEVTLLSDASAQEEEMLMDAK